MKRGNSLSDKSIRKKIRKKARKNFFDIHPDIELTKEHIYIFNIGFSTGWNKHKQKVRGELDKVGDVLIVGKTKEKCFICKEETYLVEPNYGCYICSDKCLNKIDKEFQKAYNEGLD